LACDVAVEILRCHDVELAVGGRRATVGQVTGCSRSEGATPCRIVVAIW
jgi:hypothetical protein